MPRFKNTTKYIDITPHRSILVKIAQTGYSCEEALAELVDNSIDARISNRILKVDVKINSHLISVSDNGFGMNEKEFAECIKLGYSNKKKQLGEFGLGLKTACSSIGKVFVIGTCQFNQTEEYTLKFDEDEWLKNGKWAEFPMKIKYNVSSKKFGTTITIRDLKIKITSSLIEKVKKELSSRFRPFIEYGKVEIKVNGKYCKSEKILLTKEGKRKFSLKVGNFGKIYGWWGYKISGATKENFGFSALRRERLITVYDKIGLKSNSEIKQIVGELNMDFVPVTHDKRAWIKESKEYREAEKVLGDYMIKFIVKKAKRLITGYPACGGRVEGTIRLINMFMEGNMKEEIEKVKKGDIIVTSMTRPHFLLAIRRAGAIITDMGGTLCHAAIVAREFNIPCVVGTQNATEILKDGQRVIVDAHEGVIYEA
ncbi:MAG: PEP-utilizing enzyme [Patescibacteria group bacterium]|nr:PEP-utilizing enzyme [Patescibacteria group bacterium]